jgi:glucose-6-phosphate dehydrogenase assembly protein OpcA
MADTSSDAFLSGQGVAVDLTEIEAKLAELWGPAAERQGGPDVEKPTLTRVVLANVVVNIGSDEHELMNWILPTVEAHYPCRAIVLHRTDDPERRVRAEVSALCHLPMPGLPQVCSERIVLHAGPNAQDLIPGAVRPLLEADLPFVLWWADDPRSSKSILHDLADEANRILIQQQDPSADPEALKVGLDPTLCRYSRDVSWFGITRWRELVAQFFDPPGSDAALAGIDSVEIDVVAASAERPPRVAVWLGAWLAGQLGWTRGERRDLGSGNLDASFRGPSGAIALTIRTKRDTCCELAQITGVTLTARLSEGHGRYRLCRCAERDDDVEIEAKMPGVPSVPRMVKVDDFDAPRRVAAGLESAREDPPFRNALPHALWLLGV